MRSKSLLCLTLLATFATGALCQTKLPVQQAIEAQFPVTKATYDHKDMVTPGAVIDLLKDNLVMSAITEPTISTGTYKDGKFQYGGFNKFVKFNNAAHMNVGANRTFVAGEKFWLIGVVVADDYVQLEFLSDPINDVRYKSFVKYPFPAKGSIPTPDVVLASIKESIKAEPVEGAAAAPAQPAPPPQPAMAPNAPPPPPADAPPASPKTVSIGQTKDQVAAAFGPPTKIATIGAKEIDYYPNMKITFVNGKVTDVQ